jgi:hypothetical protein
MSQFGTIKTPDEVEQAMLNHLHTWLPTYLAEIERQKGITAGSLQAPRSYVTRNEFTKWPEDQLPALVVVNFGTAGDPKREGGGEYRVPWTLGVGAVLGARDKPFTHRLTRLYGSAIVAAILQHQSLGEYAESTHWDQMSFNDINERQGRTLASIQSIYTVSVRETINALEGPIQPVVPPTTDPGDWPEVEEVQITIQEEVP